jgi:hypothetical protein
MVSVQHPAPSSSVVFTLCRCYGCVHVRALVERGSRRSMGLSRPTHSTRSESRRGARRGPVDEGKGRRGSVRQRGFVHPQNSPMTNVVTPLGR